MSSFKEIVATLAQDFSADATEVEEMLTRFGVSTIEEGRVCLEENGFSTFAPVVSKVSGKTKAKMQEEKRKEEIKRKEEEKRSDCSQA